MVSFPSYLPWHIAHCIGQKAFTAHLLKDNLLNPVRAEHKLLTAKEGTEKMKEAETFISSVRAQLGRLTTLPMGQSALPSRTTVLASFWL